MWEFHDTNLLSPTAAVWSDNRISPRCTANVRNIRWCSRWDKVSQIKTRASALILSTCRCGELFFLPQWAESEKTTQMWEFFYIFFGYLCYTVIFYEYKRYWTNIQREHLCLLLLIHKHVQKSKDQKSPKTKLTTFVKQILQILLECGIHCFSYLNILNVCVDMHK